MIQTIWNIVFVLSLLGYSKEIVGYFWEKETDNENDRWEKKFPSLRALGFNFFFVTNSRFQLIIKITTANFSPFWWFSFCYQLLDSNCSHFQKCPAVQNKPWQIIHRVHPRFSRRDRRRPWPPSSEKLAFHLADYFSGSWLLNSEIPLLTGLL